LTNLPPKIGGLVFSRTRCRKCLQSALISDLLQTMQLCTLSLTKCLRFGLWSTLHTLKDLFTYLLTS